MLANTFVLGLAGGSKTLNRINQDSYSSEYLLQEALKSYRVRIRHTRTNPVNGRAYDRHNVEVTITTFATLTTVETYQKAYFVLENLPGESSVELFDAVADWSIASANANLVALTGWES